MKKYAQARKEQIKDVQKSFAFKLYSGIVQKTPVDTGRARGNWNVEVGKDDTSTSERKTQQYHSKDDMPDPNDDESIFISNNLPYIYKLEYGGYGKDGKSNGSKTVDGFSRQAPSGMVGVTLAKAQTYIKQAVDESDGGTK